MRIDAMFLWAATLLFASPALADPAPLPPAEETSPARAPQDDEVEYRVAQQLGRLVGVDLSDVHVESVRGAVRLYGTVESNAARDRILVATALADGVQVVRDELAVRPPGEARGGGPRDDAQLAREVRSVGQYDPGVMERPLEVESRGGVVTLRGRVATVRDARRVVLRAKAVRGVRNVRPALVVNELIVVPVDGDRNHRRR
jgi:osmotically-inducible protein OsmY